MVSFSVKGDFSKTKSFLNRLKSRDLSSVLAKYGEAGVSALSQNTPVDSGLTAASWSYQIKSSRGSVEISWTNSHIVDGVPIVILLQYGHGTGTGGYVRGRDFINPAMRPIFDRIAEEVWKEVTRDV